jgi:hypothetical protein
MDSRGTGNVSPGSGDCEPAASHSNYDACMWRILFAWFVLFPESASYVGPRYPIHVVSESTVIVALTSIDGGVQELTLLYSDPPSDRKEAGLNLKYPD